MLINARCLIANGNVFSSLPLSRAGDLSRAEDLEPLYGWLTECFLATSKGASSAEMGRSLWDERVFLAKPPFPNSLGEKFNQKAKTLQRMRVKMK